MIEWNDNEFGKSAKFKIVAESEKASLSKTVRYDVVKNTGEWGFFRNGTLVARGEHSKCMALADALFGIEKFSVMAEAAAANEAIRDGL